MNVKKLKIHKIRILDLWISCQYLRTVRWVNGYTTNLQPKVFTQRNFVADLIRLKLNSSHKSRILSHPLEDLGVTYAFHL